MKTLLIDGNNLAWRVARKSPKLISPRGERIEVIYTFIRSLHGYLEQFNPDQVIVCWDSGKPLYRLSVYPDYKAHRQVKRDESSTADRKERGQIINQIAVIQELLPLLGVKQARAQDTEADDLIAVASHMKKLGLRIIISGDRDFFQLVTKGVRVWNPNHRFLYTHKNFKEKMHISPENWLLVRVLSGDSSDNIPPVAKGIGEKTAIKYLGLPREKRIKLLAEGVAANTSRNLKLMQLSAVDNSQRLNTLIKTQLTKRTRLNPARVKEFFMQRAFVSLLHDFGEWISPFRSLR